MVAGLGLVTAVAIGIAVAVGVGQPARQATASATPMPTATTAAVAPTSTPGATSGTGSVSGPCDNLTFQTGDTPIVPPRRLGQYVQVALDSIGPTRDGGNIWYVRFFNPRSAPADAVIALEASVTGAQGALAVRDYAAGPPNSEAVPVTQPITLEPCQLGATPGPGGAGVPARGVILVGAHTGAVVSGTYTLTWRGIRLPEGTTVTEAWTVTLTCTPVTAGSSETRCR